jgi:hypothetical protein
MKVVRVKDTTTGNILESANKMVQQQWAKDKERFKPEAGKTVMKRPRHVEDEMDEEEAGAGEAGAGGVV